MAGDLWIWGRGLVDQGAGESLGLADAEGLSTSCGKTGDARRETPDARARTMDNN